MILTSHMIRNEVNDYLQSCLMGALHKVLELLHTRRNLTCQIRVYIIVILDGISAACKTLYYIGIIKANPVSRVICLGGMLYDASVPDMSSTKAPDFLQSLVCKIRHLSAPVLCLCSIGMALGLIVTEKTCKYLIYYHSIPLMVTSALPLAILPIIP